MRLSSSASLESDCVACQPRDPPSPTLPPQHSRRCSSPPLPNLGEQLCREPRGPPHPGATRHPSPTRGEGSFPPDPAVLPLSLLGRGGRGVRAGWERGSGGEGPKRRAVLGPSANRGGALGDIRLTVVLCLCDFGPAAVEEARADAPAPLRRSILQASYFPASTPMLRGCSGWAGWGCPRTPRAESGSRSRLRNCPTERSGAGRRGRNRRPPRACSAAGRRAGSRP